MARTSLHGRETEVHHLSEAITAVAAGQGCVILVEGTAGLGKSRLLLEAATRARRAGIAVAGSETDEFHGLSPLASLLAAMRRSMPRIHWDAELETANALDDDQRLLIEQFTVVLQEITRRQPVLVTLDDLQWADPLMLLAARSATEQLAASPVMWLLSRRPWPTTPALDGVVSDMVGNGATVIELAPLPTSAVAEMAADVLGAAPDNALLVLLEKCAGNPFMVVELLRTLAEQDELVMDAASARFFPGGPSGSVYQRLSGRLSSLSPLTRQMLEVASIFGRLFDVRCVAQVLHRTVAELLPSLHEALGEDLVVEEGTQLGFRHALVREAAYSALPVSARRTLHREAADALRSVGGSAVDAAAHMTKGAEVGDAHAVALLVQASDELALIALGEAADLRLRAVDLMPPTDLRAQRVAETNGLLLLAEREEEGEALGEAAVQAKLPAELQARLHVQPAQTVRFGGRPAAALHPTRTALELQGVSNSTRALPLAAESNVHLVSADPRAALRAGEEAMATGREQADRAAPGRTLLTIGDAERMRGRLVGSLELIDHAVELLSSDSAGSGRIEAQWTRGRTLIALDRFDEASAAFQSAMQGANRLNIDRAAVPAHSSHAMLLLHQGALDDAMVQGDAGLVRAQELGSWSYAPELSAVLAEVAAYRGELEQARGHLRRGTSLTGERTGFAAQLAWASAVIEEAAGAEPSRVLSRLALIYEQLPDHVLALVLNPMIGPCLVALALRAGDGRRARVAAEAAESLGRGNPGVTSLAAAGMQARGLLNDDVDCLVAAARAFQASPRPLARARACEDAGLGLVHKCRSAQAVDHFMMALVEYERIGAHSPARRVRERLSSIAARDQERSAAGRPAFGWGSLTEAELRVARLAAGGLTNRSIANELSLSPHTVESHLRHTFHKLDIRSRVELTRIVLTHEPTDA
ncbi:AAA family ATPase [Kribbella sp. NPDC051137]|uniref:helix-turn-helix transcriptional regulator n=1 Tax=Kribbella sp. NPDC051137 TaxID=3155045 RepID=UPI00343F76D4